jgi:2-polyprenyl-6-methoxyphenol hydroxylase-like FAD-dependent oxidoreductase
MDRFDVCVRGAGIVGQCLALSLARQGLRVAMVPAPQSPTGGKPDVRAYALNAASVAGLRALKVWDALPPDARTPVHDMSIRGDAPGATLAFSAWQQRVSELAWITDAAALEQALDAAVRYSPHVSVLAQAPQATLTALCEGKDSSTRDSLGVAFDRHDDGHRAIAARLTASLPHQHVAHQWFRSPDVLALLPFDRPQAAQSFALVWSMPGAQAQSLMALGPEDFEARLNEATQGAAGTLSLAGERAAWPLSNGLARSWCGPGWVLLGDAAHVVHPLAGQGLNLGLADVAALCEVVAAREPWRALDDPRLLRRYERRRLLPTQAMGHLTDGLLQLFSHEQPALRELRNRGMGLLDQLSPLKRWLTDRALNS